MTLLSRQGLPRVLAALFSGVVLSFVSPPNGFAWLHWVAFVPLFCTLVPDQPKLNFKLGYITGVSGVFCLFFWLAQTIDLFSNIPLAAASLVVLLFALVWGLPYGLLAMAIHPLRQRYGHGWILLFPTVWIAVEYLWPSLFPYYQGVGQYRTPWIWQLASVFGAYGISYLIIAVNAALASFVPSNLSGFAPLERRPLIPAAVVGLLMAATLGFGAWRFQMVEDVLATAPRLKASILQQKITMVERMAERRGTTAFRSWVDITRPILGQPVDLVVWPEGSMPYNPTEERVAAVLKKLTVEGNFNFLVGGGTMEDDPTGQDDYIAHNSCYLFNRQGEVTGRYDKMVPLPFGEYLPWPISYLRGYIRGPGNFHAGTEAHVFTADRMTTEGPVPFRFTTPICYEAILERAMRKLMDTDIFVNITNDGWFGDTAAPHQHAMLSVAYATSLGRPMLRVAYTGISMVVEPHGVIREETKPYTDVSRIVEIPLASFETPYRTWGAAFPLLAALTGLGSLAYALWPRRMLVSALLGTVGVIALVVDLVTWFVAAS
jgi:apolipoprotein N-acyltransferase